MIISLYMLDSRGFYLSLSNMFDEGGELMAFVQKDYYISTKDNEYYKVMGLIKHSLEKSRIDDGTPMWNEILEKLYKELEENQGDKVTPWQYNMIIMLLLDYVPDEIKDSY